MKQRLLVMNGQKLVENNENGEWSTVKVDKAGAIKPGIYNIHLSSQADKSKTYDGVVLHADKDYVYQQIGKAFVKHDASSFDKTPEMGSNSSIKYDGDKATVSVLSNSIKKGLSR